MSTNPDFDRGILAGQHERATLSPRDCDVMGAAALTLLVRHDAGEPHVIPHGDAEFVRGRALGLTRSAQGACFSCGRAGHEFGCIFSRPVILARAKAEAVRS